MIKAACYARYSSDMQNPDSIEAQLKECHEFAVKNDMEVIHDYVDEALSGKTDERESFQQMVSDAKKGMFEALIVHKIDRFARNRYDSAIYKAQLKRNGVKIYYAAQNLSDNPEGRLMEGILESFAQYYSENLAGEVMKKLKLKASKSEFTGGIPALGYDVVDKKYVINEYEANIVKTIFEMHSSGRTYEEIFETMKEKGYKTKAGRDFGKNSLNSILQNQKYIGNYIYNKTATSIYGKRNSHKTKSADEIIIIPNSVPAIIDMDTWNRSQKRIREWKTKRAQYKASAIYLLSGIIYCGECGSSMSADKRNNGYQYYYYYRCYNKACKLNVRKEEIEAHVMEQWNKQFFSKEAIRKLARSLNEHMRKSFAVRDQEQAKIEKALRKTEGEINNIVKAISDGLNSPALVERLKTLEQAKRDMSFEVLSLKSQNEQLLYTPDEIEVNLNLHKSYLENKDLDKCKAMVSKYISKVTVSRRLFDIDFSLDYILKKMNKCVDTFGVASSAPSVSTLRNRNEGILIYK